MTINEIYEIACKACVGTLKNDVRNGDKKQLSLKAEFNKRLSYERICEYSHDAQDLIQTAISGVLEAPADADESVIYAYAFKALNAWLQGERRAHGHKINNIYLDSESFEELLEKELDTGVCALAGADTLADGTYNLTKITHEYIKSLELRERLEKIAIWLCDGYTSKEIAKKLNISESRVSQLVSELRDILTPVLLNN